MGSSENVRMICESLQALGYKCASDKILDALMHSVDDPLTIVSLGLNTAVTAEKSTLSVAIYLSSLTSSSTSTQ